MSTESRVVPDPGGNSDSVRIRPDSAESMSRQRDDDSVVIDERCEVSEELLDTP